MDFMTAVRTCLEKYADFNGRARRSEYWFFILGVVGVSIIAGILDAIIGSNISAGTGIFGLIVGLGLIVPKLSAGARRLHDTGRSGWLQLIGLIPCVGWIILIVLLVGEGNPGDNQYGPNPKGVAGPDTPNQFPPAGPDYGASGSNGPNYGQ